jgi:Carbohydrate binding module (family 6)
MIKTLALSRNLCGPLKLSKLLKLHLFGALLLVIYSASAQAVVFQAENYNAFYDATPGNKGGAYRNDDVDIEATTDSGGGYNVGWIDANEWLAFNNLVIPSSGKYTIKIRVASPSGAAVSVDLSGGAIRFGDLDIPATGGWQNWTTISKTVNINAGTYSLGVFAKTAGWNFNWIEVVADGGGGSTGSIATIYQDCNYGGWSAGFDTAGSFDMNALIAKGGQNDGASSIKVAAGYEVVLYQDWNFTGASIVVSGDNACLSNFDNKASSIVIRPKNSAVNGGLVTALPIGIENVNDSPLKESNYRTLLRFVPRSTISIDRFYFGFKLQGANCRDPGRAGYGAGDGGLLRGALVEINQATGLPGATITAETVNGCSRYQAAVTEIGGAAIPVLVWVNTPATLEGGKMYGVIVSNAHTDPRNNFFSFNMPLADTLYAGPHARNELNSNAVGALLSLDPREHVAWSENSGSTWQYGSLNGQYRSYMNDRDTAHPATRMPQYGFRLSNGSKLAGQPYYAYSSDCVNCTTSFLNARYQRTFTELGGFTASGNNVGTLTITNTSSGAEASCTPTIGYGFRKCTLSNPVTVAPGQSYTVRSTGSVEVMKMDYSQRFLFPGVGTANGELRAYQSNPGTGSNTKDVPSLWAGPYSAHYPLATEN